MFFVWLVAFIFFSYLLIRATNLMLVSLRELVSVSRVGAYGLASFVLAFSTSLPELFVSISSGVQGTSTLALGNVLGSNIANMTLVLGGAAMVGGMLKATDDFLKKDVFYVFLAGALPLVLLVDRQLSRIDGLILVLVYVLYNLTILRRQRTQLAKKEVKEGSFWKRLWVKMSHERTERVMSKLFMGVALLVFSADMIVRSATNMATIINVPILLVGMFVVAIGTSLPELAFEIQAVKHKEVEMAFGNILGSVVTNSTLVLGMATLFTPIVLGDGARAYLIGTLAFVMVFFLFWFFVWSKKVLERWEGAVLFLVYLLFAVFEFVRLKAEGFTGLLQ